MIIHEIMSIETPLTFGIDVHPILPPEAVTMLPLLGSAGNKNSAIATEQLATSLSLYEMVCRAEEMQHVLGKHVVTEPHHRNIFGLGCVHHSHLKL
jgi:hypothetical protein